MVPQDLPRSSRRGDEGLAPDRRRPCPSPPPVCTSGEPGRGNVLKLLNNYVALSNQAVLCEAMALADRLGVPRETVADVLGRSSGGSFILERKRAALAAHDYSPGFFVDLALKDLRLALELADRAGARATVAREAWRLYGEASEKGLGTLDSSGLLRLLEL